MLKCGGSSDNFTEALLFLSHIVGDIHQVFALPSGVMYFGWFTFGRAVLSVCLLLISINYVSRAFLDIIAAYCWLPRIQVPFLWFSRATKQSASSLFISHIKVLSDFFCSNILQSSCTQPLHVGFTSDGGGNTVLVEWYTHKTRLHHVCQHPYKTELAYHLNKYSLLSCVWFRL